MGKETVLEIEFTPVWDKWAWRITKQDTEVLERGVFKDDEIRVSSCTYPQFRSGTKQFFIRGSNQNLDNTVSLCTNKEKEILEEKVKAINEKYVKSKRWRAEYEKAYYYINSFGEVHVGIETNEELDDNLYKYGNYFQTVDQAEKVLEKVNKIYQGV